MPAVKQKDVLPRELPRLRTSALTGGKQYGSVMDVLQIVYGQDFGAILKKYVENHPVELHKMGIMTTLLWVASNRTARSDGRQVTSLRKCQTVYAPARARLVFQGFARL